MIDINNIGEKAVTFTDFLFFNRTLDTAMLLQREEYSTSG